MKIVAQDVPAKVGENVVTSGLDGYFPAGCWIGVVARVQKKSEMEWEVLVKPACDASAVEAVYVLGTQPAEIPWPTDPKKSSTKR
jgi:cell shape-determining protein MreC